MFLGQELKLQIPEKKLNQLHKKGFQTYGDLLRFYPRRYEDLSCVAEFGDLDSYIDQKVTIIGIIRHMKVDYGKQYVRFFVCDENRNDLPGVGVFYFHQIYMQNRFAVGNKVYMHGKLTKRGDYYSLTPDSQGLYAGDDLSPLPYYSKVAGMSAEYLKACIREAIGIAEMHMLKYPGDIEDLGTDILSKLQLDSAIDFFKKVHFPKTMADVELAKRRIDVETLLPVVVQLKRKEREAKELTDKVVHNGGPFMQVLLDSLPYKLTDDQHRAVYGMLNTMASGRRLDALLQGDVGSGKTICAAILISAVIDSGYQAALMAPTSVLASQHYKEFASYFPGRTVFLGSKLKAKERRTILSSIKDGSASLIIGTHAAIASDIEYANLALTVVDEEHRFGVAQRELLQEKAQAGAHVLSMSATPIPRSLALAVHGESTVIYDIHTMPAGRKPVKTIVFRNKEKTYASLYNQIKAGHQGYIVCPIIESNDKVEGVASITETEDALRKFFAGTDVRISCIHGAMKPTAIEDEISKFAAGQSDILLSTTIVEVGVNVPNATVMIIQNAERFGLAQLHQLRGRVCRGSAQGYCVLLSDDISNPRLQIMARTTDGFEVAKSDLELRGAGNLIGTEQSGFDRAVEIIATNQALYQEVVNSI